MTPTLSWNGIRFSFKMEFTLFGKSSWAHDGRVCTIMENEIGDTSTNGHSFQTPALSCSTYIAFKCFLQPDRRIMIMIDLDLRLEQNFVEAGGMMKGRVDLAVRFRTEASSGIHLVLVGEEVTSINCSSSTKNSGKPDEPPYLDRAKHTIIQTTIPVKTFSTGFVEAGRYNFPFEYLLPAKLPSTMACPGDDASGEIHYKLIACMPKNSGEPVLSKPFSLCVIAASPEKELHPLDVPLEQFKVKHCCFIDQGSVTLGWKTDATVGTPGSSISIGIVGKNESVVPISYVVACWDEVVTLMCNGKSKVYSRTLASTEFYPTTKLWEPLNSLSSNRRRYWNGDIESLMQNRQTLTLVLPKDARDSSQGTLIGVQHTLSVKVVSSEWCTDSPESSIMVTVQRQIPTGSSRAGRRHHGKATVTFAATPTIAPQPQPCLLPPVKVDGSVKKSHGEESQGVTCHETPMADATLVGNHESSALVTAKDAMTNTVQISSRERSKEKESRRWGFGTRKKKTA